MVDVTLAPAQRRAADGLLKAIPMSNVLVLRSDPGMGRTTVLRRMQAAVGGAFVGIRQFLDVLMSRHPSAIEEAFLRCLEDQLAENDLVIVDDLQIIAGVVYACDYPRSGMLQAVLTAVVGDAENRGKKLVFGLEKDDTPTPVGRRAHS